MIKVSTKSKPIYQSEILDFPISIASYSTFVDKIIGLAEQRNSSYVCVANVHMIIEAHKDKDFQNIINEASIVTPDGVPIVWGLSKFHKIKQERVAGMDLLPDLLKEMSQKKLSSFFYGGTEELLEKVDAYVQRHFPALKMAGTYSPPFRELTEVEENFISDHINASNADIVFVVLGCPKQERWMSAMKGKINACMVGIGGALPVMLGLKKRAPIWMQTNGLEWLYRLYQEPKRMFKRYAVTNTFFGYLMLQESFKRSFKKSKK